jgi:hypothetical protein
LGLDIHTQIYILQILNVERHPTEFLIGLDISNRVSCGAGYTVLYSVRRVAGYVPKSFILVDISLKTPREAEYIL